jgi:hypothetical protein
MAQATTYLEYLLTHYLGTPTRVLGNGVSYWPCPLCKHASFHTLPDKPQFQHRAKCWNAECGFRGNAADMVKEFHPDENYNERLDRIYQLQNEWEQKQGLVMGRVVKKRAGNAKGN